MGMVKEFKEFAMKGNLVDMGVAFVIGASFTAVTKSFIDGIIMPPLSLLWGGGVKGEVVLREGVEAVTNDAGEVVTEAINKVAILYGDFLSALISFIIVAFVMFLLVKSVNNMKKKEEPAPEAPKGPSTEELLAEIRDELKKK